MALSAIMTIALDFAAIAAMHTVIDLPPLFNFRQEWLKPSDQFIEWQFVIFSDSAEFRQLLRIPQFREERVEYIESFFHGWDSRVMPRKKKSHAFIEDR